jgi:membrane associated rhomboid family serine protease
MGLDSRDYYNPSGHGGFSFFPPVLKKILIVNVVIFFIQMISDNLMFGGIPMGRILDHYFALNPLGDYPDGGPSSFYVWQLLTYQFMHGSFTHILFNMFMLWMFGMEIENMMGSKKFLIFYLVCGVGAGLVQLLIPPLMGEAVGPTIGASGAVFGIMIAFAMYFPDRYILLYFLIPIKAKYMIAFLVVIEFLSVGNQSLIAHFAHIGGAATAFIFILIDRKNRLGVSSMFDSIKRPRNTFSSSGFGRTFGSRKTKHDDIEDAKFYDINDSTRDNDVITQDDIDRILDKISQSGYQNLTDREKKILFEASKRK